MRKFEDVLGRFEAKRLSAMGAAESPGMSERSFRRYRWCYEDEGLEGLFDRRRCPRTASHGSSSRTGRGMGAGRSSMSTTISGTATASP